VRDTRASRLPMRNWNHGGIRFSTLSRVASRLPMRNWNMSFTQRLSRGDSMASRLPMRNWNVTWKTESKKHRVLPDYLWGIETPQRVKCLPWVCWLPDYLWGIETCRPDRISHDRRASRLPMRNWNFSPLEPNPFSPASRLPMRNWNPTLARLPRQTV